MKNESKRAKKNRWPMALVSLAIVLVAGFGFANILMSSFADTSPEPLQILTEVSKTEHRLAETPAAEPVITAPKPTGSPITTPKPTAVASQDNTLPTLKPESRQTEVAFSIQKQTEVSSTSISTPTPIPTPTPGPLAGLKIGIDPGHQMHANSSTELVFPSGSKEKKPKVASGTSGVSTKVPEYVVNLQIAFKLRDALEAQGAEVLMARESDDVDISNVERAVMMNEWGADLVLRIHCNGVDSRSKNGIGLYVRKTGTLAEESYQAAEKILKKMVETTGARKDGIFKRDIYSGLNWSEVPSILVENGYMSNPDEDKKLNDPDYQQLLVDGMVQGVADYFERELTGEGGGTTDATPLDGAGGTDDTGSGPDESGAVG